MNSSQWDFLNRNDAPLIRVGQELRVSPDKQFVSTICTQHSQLYPRNPIPFNGPTTNAALRRAALGLVVKVVKVDLADNTLKVQLPNGQTTWFPIGALARPGSLSAAQGSQSVFQAPAALTVSGAGTPEVNGLYVRGDMADGMPVYYNKKSPYDAWTGERIKIWYCASYHEWRIGRSAFNGTRMHKYYVCRGSASAISNPAGWTQPPSSGLGQDGKPILHPSSRLPAPTVTFPGQQPPVVYQQPMYPQHQQQAVPHPQAYYNGQTPQMMHNGHPGQYVQHSQPYPTQQYVQHAVPLNQHYPQQKMMHNGHSNQMSNQMYQQPMQGQQLFNQALHY